MAGGGGPLTHSQWRGLLANIFLLQGKDYHSLASAKMFFPAGVRFSMSNYFKMYFFYFLRMCQH